MPVAELAILSDSHMVAIHPEACHAHAMRGLFAFRVRFPFILPIEPAPEPVDLILVAAHDELSRSNVYHLRTIDRIDPVA